MDDDEELRDQLRDLADENLSAWEMDFIESVTRGHGPLSEAQREKAQEIVGRFS